MKCKECGKEFAQIRKRDLTFSVISSRGARGYHPCSRTVLRKQRNWCFYLSVFDDGDHSPRSNTPHPVCPSCFLAKMRRAIVALENALEGKEPADEEKQEVAATASASAPEVTKEEPFDYDKLTDEEKNRQYWRLFAEKGDEPTELEKRQNRVWTQNEVRRRQLKNLPI